MKCTKCNSENVQVQVTTEKNNFTGAFTVMFLGFGLMFFGILGAIIGSIIGVTIGFVVSTMVGDFRGTICVCQDCGHSFKPDRKDR